jgi:hypothetical protein
LPETGIINIDTGCGKGGNLTALIVDGEYFCVVTQEKLPSIEECLKK